MDSFERKPSSSDLLSRLKTRKLLGVGESSGKTTVSKITQLLGQKSENIDDRPVLSFVLYWNYFISASFLITGAVILIFGNSCGKYIADYLFHDLPRDTEITEQLYLAIVQQRHLFSIYFAVAIFCIGSTMLYSITMIRSGGLRMAQFCSTVFFLLIILVTPVATQNSTWRLWFISGFMLINTMCHLQVAFPHWPLWEQLERKLACSKVKFSEASACLLPKTCASSPNSPNSRTTTGPPTAPMTDSVETAEPPATASSSTSTLTEKHHSD